MPVSSVMVESNSVPGGQNSVVGGGIGENLVTVPESLFKFFNYGKMKEEVDWFVRIDVAREHINELIEFVEESGRRG